MPVAVTVGATLRNKQPVAVLRFRDGDGQRLTLHLSPSTVLDLQVQLAKFSQRGARKLTRVETDGRMTGADGVEVWAQVQAINAAMAKLVCCP